MKKTPPPRLTVVVMPGGGCCRTRMFNILVFVVLLAALNDPIADDGFHRLEDFVLRRRDFRRKSQAEVLLLLVLPAMERSHIKGESDCNQ